MKSLIKILFGIFLMPYLVSCQQGPVTSTDFSEESEFTSGIEGPAVNAEGLLFAVNFEKEGTIGKVDQNGQAELYITLPDGSIGNGIRFDADGHMYIADYKGHSVYRVSQGSKVPEVWVRDSTMNQPNDLALDYKGGIYLSDPNWAESTGNLWYVSPDRKLIRLEENMGTTNGVEVSPDGKYLYVNESVQRNVWRYSIGENGRVSNKTLFHSFDDFGMDGMRCDMKGNLYITRYGKGTVAILNPEGKLLQEVILKGKKPSNITFGGTDGTTCFVTLQDRGCLEQFSALNPGNHYNKIH
ncbi:MAG: SMP-30/gluconolactonase/LRE family protein [Bacteroidota bacterium]